jgi:hypothetical protein
MMGMRTANDSPLSNTHCTFYMTVLPSLCNHVLPEVPMLASHGAALSNNLTHIAQAQFGMQSTEPSHHKFQV